MYRFFKCTQVHELLFLVIGTNQTRSIWLTQNIFEVEVNLTPNCSGFRDLVQNSLK
jgi:hypothetical protein